MLFNEKVTIRCAAARVVNGHGAVGWLAKRRMSLLGAKTSSADVSVASGCRRISRVQSGNDVLPPADNLGKSRCQAVEQASDIAKGRIRDLLKLAPLRG